MRRKILFSLFLIIAAISVQPLAVQAANLKWVKNKFGIHLLDNAQDLPAAAKLLNSHGGDWSWVVLVLRDNDLNKDKWQNIFNLCRRHHLIPLIRLATHAQKTFWAAPTPSLVHREITFLGKLNWPTQMRVIIAFNEPNRGDEWGKQASPQAYGAILATVLKEARQQKKQFFLLPAGLDLAAPNKPPAYFSAENFYYRLWKFYPHLLSQFDGLASHSYPNHGFRGSPQDRGKTSIRGYQWELAYLRRLGLKKKLPVFITETGWPHRQGTAYNSSFLPSKTIGQYLEQAFRIWSTDPRVTMFAPFLLRYSLPPLDHFSWQKPDGNFYPYANILLDWAKQANAPRQRTKAEILAVRIPLFLAPGQKTEGKILLRNQGQSIWGEKTNPYCFASQGSLHGNLCAFLKHPIEPGNQTWFHFSLTAPKATSYQPLVWRNGVRLNRRFFVLPHRYLLSSPVCLQNLNRLAYLGTDLRRYLNKIACTIRQVLLE